MGTLTPGTTGGVPSVAVGTSPIGVTAGAGSVWVVGVDDDSVTRIDAGTGRRVAVVKVGHRPSEVAFAPGRCGSATTPTRRCRG